MQISYGLRDSGLAERGCVEVYGIAEKKLGYTDLRGCYQKCLWCKKAQLRNAFQVYRYAIKEWAEDKPREVVWQMLMHEDCRAREVSPILGDSENVIYCEDESTGEILEEMLRKEGYEED